MQLSLTVSKTSFSAAASTSSGGTSNGGGNGGTGGAKEPTASLQISGRVTNENEYVRLGAFHTLDLEGELGWGGGCVWVR